jgi:hypothetical protein
MLLIVGLVIEATAIVLAPVILAVCVVNTGPTMLAGISLVTSTGHYNGVGTCE